MLAPPGVFIQMPVQPSHHMATLPSGTTSFSMSSTSQVPHSGKVALIQESLVISDTLLIVISPLSLKRSTMQFRWSHGSRRQLRRGSRGQKI